MQVKLARTAGFCMGVKRAMEIALQTAQSQNLGIFTCGPLIHNPQAVEALREKGIRVITDWRTLGQGVILIRAHGMPRQEIEDIRAHGFPVVDATCPHVVVSQKRIQQFAEKGFFIVIVGDPKHPEILSLQSFAGSLVGVISSLEEAERLPPLDKVMVIAQTTFNEAQYREISQAVARKGKESRVFHSICKATSNRQDEVAHLAESVDAIVVVGGRDSANTRRLAEIAMARGKPTWQVETASELPLEDFRQYRTVGVTAGASTPTWITNEVLEALLSLDRERNPLRFYVFQGLRLLINTNVLVSLSAAGLALFLLSTEATLGETFATGHAPLLPVLIFCCVFALFTANPAWRATEEEPDTGLSLHLPPRALLWRRSLQGLSAIGGILGALSLIIAFSLVRPLFWLLAVIYAATFLYSNDVFSFLFPTWTKRPGKHLPGFKDGFLALAVSSLIVAYPLTSPSFAGFGPTIFYSFYAFGMIFWRNVALDLRDLEFDRIIGRDTLPVFLGRTRTETLLALISAGLFAAASLFLIFQGMSPMFWSLLVGPIFFFLFLTVTHRGHLPDEILYELSLDGLFVVLGTLGMLLLR